MEAQKRIELFKSLTNNNSLNAEERKAIKMLYNEAKEVQEQGI